MKITWKHLSFVPSREALDALRAGWSWLVDPAMRAFMCATSGDVFFEAADGSVHWLDTGIGSLDRIAADREEFVTLLREDGGTEWLMAPLVAELLEAGAVVAEGQCFGYKLMPVIGGEYEAANMYPLSAAVWYGFAGDFHEQIKDLPDGAHIRFPRAP